MKKNWTLITLLLMLVIVLLWAYCNHQFSKNPDSNTSRALKKTFCKPSPTWKYPPLPPERTINFPLNESVGLLYTSTGRQGYGDGTFGMEFFGEAKGLIKLPEDNMQTIQNSFIMLQTVFVNIIERMAHEYFNKD